MAHIINFFTKPSLFPLYLEFIFHSLDLIFDPELVLVLQTFFRKSYHQLQLSMNQRFHSIDPEIQTQTVIIHLSKWSLSQYI